MPEIFIRLIEATAWPMAAPKPYSPFHLLLTAAGLAAALMLALISVCGSAHCQEFRIVKKPRGKAAEASIVIPELRPDGALRIKIPADSISSNLEYISKIRVNSTVGLCPRPRIHPAQTRILEDLQHVKGDIIRILRLIIWFSGRNLKMMILNFARLLHNAQHVKHQTDENQQKQKQNQLFVVFLQNIQNKPPLSLNSAAGFHDIFHIDNRTAKPVPANNRNPITTPMIIRKTLFLFSKQLGLAFLNLTGSFLCTRRP